VSTVKTAHPRRADERTALENEAWRNEGFHQSSFSNLIFILQHCYTLKIRFVCVPPCHPLPARNHIAVTQRVTHYNSGFLHTSLSGACGSRQSYDCPSANNQPMSNISSGPDDTLRNFISARSVLALQYKTHLRKPTTKDTLLRPRAIARNIVTYDCPEKQKGSEVGPRVTKNILRDSPEP
jgi:hypothetical protein